MPLQSCLLMGKSGIFHLIFPERYQISPSIYRIFSEEKILPIQGKRGDGNRAQSWGPSSRPWMDWTTTKRLMAAEDRTTTSSPGPGGGRKQNFNFAETAGGAQVREHGDSGAGARRRGLLALDGQDGAPSWGDPSKTGRRPADEDQGRQGADVARPNCWTAGRTLGQLAMDPKQSPNTD